MLSYTIGGISKFGGKLSGNIISKTLDGIDNGIARFAIQYGGRIVSEGLEEGIQEILNPIFKALASNTSVEYWGGIDWEDVAYSALLGGLSSGMFELSSSITTNLNNNKLNPDEVVEGIWEGSPNKSKNIVEKSQLETFDNNSYDLYNNSETQLSTSGNSGEKAKPYSVDNIPQSINQYLYKLKNYGEILEVEEPPSFSDISLMSRQSGTEFASITIGDKNYIIKGDPKGTPISSEMFKIIRKNKGILNCHSHPFIDDFRVSKEDMNVAKQMYWQKEFYIVSPDGKFATYNSNGIIDIDIIRKEFDDSDLEFYEELFKED